MCNSYLLTFYRLHVLTEKL